MTKCKSMAKLSQKVLCSLVVVAMVMFAAGMQNQASAMSLGSADVAPSNDEVANTDIEQNLRQAGLSVPFVQNAGQADESVKYSANHLMSGGSVAVTNDGLYHSFPVGEEGTTVVERFVNANGEAVALSPQGADAAKAQVSYFFGNDETKWAENLDTFNRVDLGQVAEGVNVSLHANANTVEKYFHLAPKADIANVRVAIDQADYLGIDEQGGLLINVNNQELRETAPIAWQEVNGEKEFVDVAYTVDKNIFGFEITGDYDSSKELVIDPELEHLDNSVYLGGSGEETVRDITLDANGNVFVTGRTTSNVGDFSGDFPLGQRFGYGMQTGNSEAYVAKLGDDLSLASVALLTGSNAEEAYALEVAGDSIYVTGRTNSDDFPTTAGAFSQTNEGGYDTFVSKLHINLNQLQDSTFLGGAGIDFPAGLSFEGEDLFVTGTTTSNNFPATDNVYDDSYNGGTDSYIARLNNDLSNVEVASYLGGNHDEEIQDINANGFGVYVTGYTSSATFPTTSGAFETDYQGGSNDAFVSHLNRDLKHLSDSTFLGGGGDDQAKAFSEGLLGTHYIVGTTDTTNFPSAGAGYQGGDDAFVTLMNVNLSSVVESKYLGGLQNDRAYDCDFVQTGAFAGELYVTGATYSSNFPVEGDAYDISNNGGDDAFVTKFNNLLTNIESSTYLGTSGTDEGFAIAVPEDASTAYVAGLTGSDQFPQHANEFGGGQSDAFVAALDEQTVEVQFKTAESSADENQAGAIIHAELNHETNVPVFATFEYVTDMTGSTATEGEDYEILPAGNVTFSPGETEKQIALSHLDDAVFEGDETINLELVYTTHGEIGSQNEHVHTIVENDNSPEIEFDYPDTYVTEGNDTFDVPVTLTGDSAIDSSFRYTVAGSADEGSDYVINQSQPVTIPAGQSTVNIPVEVLDDSTPEPNQTVEFTLTNPENAHLGDATTHTFTIVDNDDVPTVEFTSAASSGDESQSPAVFTARMSEERTENTYINYDITGASTASGDDYDNPGSIRFMIPAGQTTDTVEVPIVDDAIDEDNETIVMNLTGGFGIDVGGQSTHTYTIIDNDGSEDPEDPEDPEDQPEEPQITDEPQGDSSDDEGSVAGTSTGPEREPIVVAISGYGEPTKIQLYTKKGETVGPEIKGLFPANYLGGAGVARIDADEDGIEDEVIIFARDKGGPQARVGEIDRDGNFKLLGQKFVFDADIRDGLSVAVGDFDNDGFKDDAAFSLTGDYAPTVRVYKDVRGMDNWKQISEFNAPFGNVGANLGTFQYDGDADEILVTPNHGDSDPNVYVHSVNGSLKKQFTAYGPGIREGITASGIGDRIYTTPNNGTSQVNVFDKEGTRKNFWWVYQMHVKGNFMNVAGDIDGDGVDEILVSPVGGVVGPHILSFEPSGSERSFPRFFAFDENKRNGVGIGVVMLEK
ncbi:Calx-beta domain-containing protein [Patescibacteria group bacterium]